MNGSRDPVIISYQEPVSVMQENAPKDDLEQIESVKEESTDSLVEIPEEEIAVSFPLELNTATRQELEEIPGIGEVLAQRMVDYREHLNGYDSLEQLLEIQGIGEQTYLKIIPYLYITGDDWHMQQQNEETQLEGFTNDKNG